MNLRHELKHMISTADYFEIRNRLLAVCSRDENADETGKYHVRSIYFDNPYDSVLFEKTDGVRNRDKYRLRLYNLDASKINLEKKIKRDDMCIKHTAEITAEEALSLIDGSYEFLLEKSQKPNGAPVFAQLYVDMRTKLLRPKTIVDYTREAFVYRPGNVRVTFDSDIRTGVVSRSLLDKNLTTATAIPHGQMILEVKFDEFLPSIIIGAIQTGRTRRQAYSKYAAARVFI